MQAGTGPQTRAETEEDEISLRQLLAVVLESRWQIISITAAVVVAGACFSFLVSPTYRADALLQIEQQSRGIPGLDELATALGSANAPSQAEIEIIRSRSVVGRVVESLMLDVTVRPRRFPVIGGFVARQAVPGEPLRGWPGFGRFAWGGERIVVGRLSVPQELKDTCLTLTTGQSGTYTLEDEDGNLLLQGAVGKPAEADGAYGSTAIFVRELVAAPGAQFILVNRPFDLVVEDLQKSLGIGERGRQSGILAVTLEGKDRKTVTDIVNGVAASYLRQNVERRSEEASHMLSFLDKQLPAIKQELETAEAKLREYKTRYGSAVDISVEGNAMLSRSIDLEKQISMLELERSELQQRYTGQHPVLVATQQKLAQLSQSRSALDAQFKKLPDTELESVRLMRNVTVANELYIQMLNNIQGLKLAKAGTVGNVRIVDAAIEPLLPVFPNKPLVLALSLMLGLFTALMVLFMRRMLRSTLDRPDEIEERYGLTLYASIPESRAEAKLVRVPGSQLLARADPSDSAVESLRSLRTSLQFAMLDAGNSIIAIHGATPGVGKSFVATNLAALLADGNQGEVLVIDADLRKGHMQERLGIPQQPGLSEVLSGSHVLADALREIETGRLFALTTGAFPPNPAELLMHANFGKLMAEVQKRFRYVVLDCPPLLNLADAAILARHAGTNFLTVRAGLTTRHDLSFALQRFKQGQLQLRGVIFNGLNVRTSAYYYGTQVYGQRYSAGGR